MAARKTGAVSDEQRQQIIELHDGERLGRNAIARQVGVSAGTVTAVIHAAGLSFDRAATKAASEARKADCAALRSQLELELLQDARRLRGLLWREADYREYGGRDFTLRKWRQPTPQPADQLKLMQAATLAVDRSLKISDADRDTGIDTAKSMLGTLQQQLGRAFRDAQAEEAAG